MSLKADGEEMGGPIVDAANGEGKEETKTVADVTEPATGGMGYTGDAWI